MTGRVSCVVAALVALAEPAGAAPSPVQVLLPLSGPNCVMGHAYRVIASVVNANLSAGYTSAPLQLDFVDIGTTTSGSSSSSSSSPGGGGGGGGAADGGGYYGESGYLASSAILDNATAYPPRGYRAVLGPLYSHTALLALPAAQRLRVPLVLFQPTSLRLGHVGGPRQLVRYGATAANYADATVALVRHYGWRSFSLLSASDLHGQGFAEVMLNNAAGSSSSSSSSTEEGSSGGAVAGAAAAAAAAGGHGSAERPLRVSTHAQFTPHGLDPALFEQEAAYVTRSLLALTSATY